MRLSLAQKVRPEVNFMAFIDQTSQSVPMRILQQPNLPIRKAYRRCPQSIMRLIRLTVIILLWVLIAVTPRLARQSITDLDFETLIVQESPTFLSKSFLPPMTLRSH